MTTAGGLALCLTAAEGLDTTESLVVTGPQGPIEPSVVTMAQGTRIHLLHAGVGELVVRYDATVRTPEPEPAAVSAADRLTYILPSRYVPSDRLGGWATGEFGSSEDEAATVLRVADWVFERTSYTPGSTGPTDDAMAPLLTGQGVCRDYAHLTVSVLRALDIPARYVSVYAPGLDPMDAHAVVEAAVDGHWYVVDSTRLAPRRSMIRCGTGRDATDVALMTTLGAETGPFSLEVTATAQPDLPTEDPTALVALA